MAGHLYKGGQVITRVSESGRAWERTKGRPCGWLGLQILRRKAHSSLYRLGVQ